MAMHMVYVDYGSIQNNATVAKSYMHLGGLPQTMVQREILMENLQV